MVVPMKCYLYLQYFNVEIGLFKKEINATNLLFLSTAEV